MNQCWRGGDSERFGNKYTVSLEDKTSLYFSKTLNLNANTKY